MASCRAFQLGAHDYQVPARSARSRWSPLSRGHEVQKLRKRTVFSNSGGGRGGAGLRRPNPPACLGCATSRLKELLQTTYLSDSSKTCMRELCLQIGGTGGRGRGRASPVWKHHAVDYFEYVMTPSEAVHKHRVCECVGTLPPRTPPPLV